MAASNIVIFWVIVGVIFAVTLVATLFLAIAAQRSAQQAQMKEAERPSAASLQPQGGEQPPAHAPEEEKILLRQ